MTTKYILYGQSRSGSTWLHELLDSHPEITCEGELLTAGWGYLDNRLIRYLVRQYPYPYFSSRVRQTKTPVYGFKLLRHNMRTPGAYLPYLERDNWKIIFIRRTNLLRQALSNVVAQKTGHWYRGTDMTNPTYRVTISKDELKQAMDLRLRWTEEENQFMAHYDYCYVNYENDLCQDTEREDTLRRLYAFLGVRNNPAKNWVDKTDLRRYQDIIENYDELIRYLLGTPFSQYLVNGEI